MNDRQPLHVAVVDDDPSLCRSLGRFLRASGIESRVYDSAESFLADSDSRFDCLLLDVQLGGLSGLDLARQLRVQGDGVPFIFVTAYNDDDTKASARELGCAGYLLKNGPGAEVIEAIRRAVSGVGPP
ncbi:response regulator transcription factor [Variovorax sp. GT1P44]|uniref:response regulator transcription factor n=1 Tax=Variovorax sp. GT1P44 TaxID=3443742 RepID=UPI003F48DEDC